MQITYLLDKAADGDLEAQDDLFQAVQDQLRVIATAQLRHEPADPIMQTTLLVDEAFVRLVVDRAGHRWSGRIHFFRAAARAMRNLLVDFARQRQTVRRGGEFSRRSLEHLGELATEDRLGQSVNLDEASNVDRVLDKLAACDPRSAQVVELRYFAGRTFRETAKLLNISERTAKNDWAAARIFLHRELGHVGDDV